MQTATYSLFDDLRPSPPVVGWAWIAIGTFLLLFSSVGLAVVSALPFDGASAGSALGAGAPPEAQVFVGVLTAVARYGRYVPIVLLPLAALIVTGGVGLVRQRPWGRPLALWLSRAVAVGGVVAIGLWLYALNHLVAFAADAPPEARAFAGFFGTAIGMQGFMYLTMMTVPFAVSWWALQHPAPQRQSPMPPPL